MNENTFFNISVIKVITVYPNLQDSTHKFQLGLDIGLYVF